MLVILIFFFAHWYISLFFQSFFHHRYAAHKMFTMSPVWEKIFHFLSYVSQGSSYLSPYAYGILHRLHHAHVDTDDDPHSPRYDKNLFVMMWKTKVVYSSILRGEKEVEAKYKKDLPTWTKFDLFGDSWFSRIFWVVFYVSFYVIFAPSAWFYLLLPIHFIMGPFHGAIINWFAHKYGYTNFKVKDDSRNLIPLDILMLGEGYHNNHHKFASRPNFGIRWFEIDPVYPIILTLNFFKVIQLKKAVVRA